jgi:hypothetical protein
MAASAKAAAMAWRHRNRMAKAIISHRRRRSYRENESNGVSEAAHRRLINGPSINKPKWRKYISSKMSMSAEES